MRRVAVPAVLILILTAAYAGLAAYNRGGDPVTALVLTERELALPWMRAGTGDHPGVSLRTVVDQRAEPLDARNWLTMDRLEALGFEVTVPAGAPEAERFYRRTLPRPAWVVLEYAGQAWEARERRRSMSAPARGRDEWSRLVPVDAGPDRDALVERYGDGRHLVLRGVIDLSFLPAEAGGPLMYGRLQSLVPPEVHVPSDMAQVLEGMAPAERALTERGSEAEPPTPRYEVDVAVGRLGLPYVRAVRLLP